MEKRKSQKRVGVHLETRDHQKTVNGREKERGAEIIKIGRERQGPGERETGERKRQREREMVIEMTASDGQGFDTLVKTVALRLKFL